MLICREHYVLRDTRLRMSFEVKHFYVEILAFPWC